MDAEGRQYRISTANLAAFIHVLVLVAIIMLGYRRSIAADPDRYPHENVFEMMGGAWCILLAGIYLLAKVKTPPLRAVLQFSVPMLLISALLIIADLYPVVHSSEPAIAQEQVRSILMPAAKATMTVRAMAASAEATYLVSLDGETVVGMPLRITGASNIFHFKNSSENSLRVGLFAFDTTSMIGTSTQQDEEPICATSCGQLMLEMEIKKGATKMYSLGLAPGTYSIACITVDDGHEIRRCTPFVFTVRNE